MSTQVQNCFHLTVDMVQEIHAEALARFGGTAGIRTPALLESAVAAPQATTFSDPIEVGAAYLFYLCRNHPFIDGNKRAALGACLTFSRLNGFDPQRDGPEWEKLTLAVASSELDRAETTKRLKKIIKRNRGARS